MAMTRRSLRWRTADVRSTGPTTPKAWAGAAARAAQVLTGLALLAALGCSRKEEPLPASRQAEGARVDPAEQVRPGGEGRRPADWLGEVRRVHERADRAGDPREQQGVLDRMQELWRTVPPSLGSSVEALELRQELAARAARLELAAGRPREARRWAEQGLALKDGVSALRAVLWLVIADAHEVEGNGPEARGALKEALGSHQQLLERELEEP